MSVRSKKTEDARKRTEKHTVVLGFPDKAAADIFIAWWHMAGGDKFHGWRVVTDEREWRR